MIDLRDSEIEVTTPLDAIDLLEKKLEAALKENRILAESLATTDKELAEVQQDLTEQYKENEKLLSELSKYKHAVEHMKPASDKATQAHLEGLAQRLHLAESILNSLMLSMAGYNASKKVQA